MLHHHIVCTTLYLTAILGSKRNALKNKHTQRNLVNSKSDPFIAETYVRAKGVLWQNYNILCKWIRKITVRTLQNTRTKSMVVNHTL